MPRTADERSLSYVADRRPAADLAKPAARGIAKLVAAYRAPPRARRRTLVGMLDGVSGLGWSVVGFVGGAVFWHFIGFWGFVSDVVLAGGPDGRTVSRPSAAFVRVAEAEVVVSNCTTIALDRATGRAMAVACEDEGYDLRDDTGPREDRLTVGRR